MSAALPESGIVLLDKPEGMTSQSAVSRFKRDCHVKSAGHTGTLDPLATGLLIVCYGRATRCAEFLTGCGKRYEATLLLGTATDTGDITGSVVSVCGKKISAERVEAALSGFRGEIAQVPPAYCAVKKNGVPFYKLARAGSTEVPPERKITVYGLELTWADEEKQRFGLDIRCSAGTYVRSLCRDIGAAAGSVGTMAALRRTDVGAFSVLNALSPDGVKAAFERGDTGFALPKEAAFAGLERLIVPPQVEWRLRNGLPCGLSTLARGRVAVVSESGELLALGEASEADLEIIKRLY